MGRVKVVFKKSFIDTKDPLLGKDKDAFLEILSYDRNQVDHNVKLWASLRVTKYSLKFWLLIMLPFYPLGANSVTSFMKNYHSPLTGAVASNLNVFRNLVLCKCQAFGYSVFISE